MAFTVSVRHTNTHNTFAGKQLLLKKVSGRPRKMFSWLTKTDYKINYSQLKSMAKTELKCVDQHKTCTSAQKSKEKDLTVSHVMLLPERRPSWRSRYCFQSCLSVCPLKNRKKTTQLGVNMCVMVRHIDYISVTFDFDLRP